MINYFGTLSLRNEGNLFYFNLLLNKYLNPTLNNFSLNNLLIKGINIDNLQHILIFNLRKLYSKFDSYKENKIIIEKNQAEIVEVFFYVLFYEYFKYFLGK